MKHVTWQSLTRQVLYNTWIQATAETPIQKVTIVKMYDESVFPVLCSLGSLGSLQRAHFCDCMNKKNVIDIYIRYDL